MPKTPPAFPVGQLFEHYEIQQFRYRLDQERLDAQIKRLTERRQNMVYPHFIDLLVQPIGKALLPYLPGYTMQILGPFGLCAAVSIHFARQGMNSKTHGDTYWQTLKSITFIPYADHIAIRDSRRSTGTYRPGTLGELNGMNHPTVPIPEDADAQWFLQWLDKDI